VGHTSADRKSLLTRGIFYDNWNIEARGREKKVWKITDLDYEAPLFSNAEARLGAGVGPTLWAKWLHRGFNTPTRTGRGGHLYSALKIFEMRIFYVLVEEVTIPPSEAVQIAQLTANGKWKSLVIRDSSPPLDVCLVFSRTKNCWGYEILGADSLKNNASVVIAAARELRAVSKYCWNILEDSGRTTRVRKD